MGEFNNRHLDFITYSSNFDAKTILDLYTSNIYKNYRITNFPFCCSEIKQNQTDISVVTNIDIDRYTNLKVSLVFLYKHVRFTNISKGVKNILMSSDY